MRHPALRWALGLGLVAGGCPSNPQNETTDAETDGCAPGELNCICAADGCDPGLVCSGGVCVSFEGTTSVTTTSSTGASDGTTSTTDPSGTTGSSGDSSTTIAPQCSDGPGPSMQCPPDAPFCEGGSCVDCTAIASCAEYDPASPVCDPASGACVECTAGDDSACSGATPVCDAALQECVKCSAHAQCDSGACDLESGECFPADSVLWVDRSANPCGVGSKESPFCEIQDAVKTIGANNPTVVKVLDGPMNYTQKIDILGGATVAIVAESGTPTVDVASDAMLINDGARVFVAGIKLIGTSMTAAKGILCLSADLWTDLVDVSSRESMAIDAVGCQVRIERARVYLNTGGGLRLNGGSLRIVNSFVASNGGPFSANGGIHLTGSAALDAVYTTVIGNNADQNAGSLHCPSPGTVTLRNSVLFGANPATSVNCPGATGKDSVVDAMTLGGDGVTVLGKYDTKWFKNPGLGDFHATDLAPFKDVAKWRSGDPAVDYDGDVRPSEDLAADWAGADRL
jgi:hypothetical protein